LILLTYILIIMPFLFVFGDDRMIVT